MADRIFTSKESLKNDINKKIKEAHKNTAKRLIDKLHEIEEENVYNKPALFYASSDSGSVLKGLYYGFALWEYDRTYDLYDVIRLYKIGSNQYQSIAEIRPVAGSLSHDYTKFQHDTPFSYPIDEEMYLDIIENGLSSEHSMFGTIKPRPFWKEFIDYCEDNYYDIFEEEMDKLM